MSRRSLTSALAAAVLAAGCGGGSEKQEPPSQQRALLGVDTGAAVSRPALFRREVRVMASSGVTTIRVPFYWSIAQPKRGRPDFAATDWIVEAASKAHIAVLPVVLGTPRWAARHPGSANSPPAGTGAYASFLSALIDHYGPRGSYWKQHPKLPRQPLRDWQLWNEPDHLKYWSDQPYARDYVALARAARRAIKRADPGARVVLSGFADRSWESVRSVYAAGGKGVFDVVAIHPYTFEPRNVLRIVRLTRAVLRRAGDPGRPLWLTEVTWSSGLRPGRPRLPFETTERDQAARLGQLLPLLLETRRALGVERIYWENWLSNDRDHANPFDFSGLRALSPDGSVRPKPAFFAFRRVALRTRGRGS